MSVVSSRSSHVALMRRSLVQRTSLVATKFHVHDKTVRNSLVELLEKGNRRLYEDLVCALRDGVIKEEGLAVVLVDCVSCVNSMKKETRLLVEALLAVNWPSMDSIINLFAEWMISLLTAHVHFAPLAIDSLVKLLGKSIVTWHEDPPKEQVIVFSHIHQLIAKIVMVVPMSVDILLQSVIKNFPYYKQGLTINRAYIHNMLWMVRYLPSLTDDIISLIISRLIAMDVHVHKDVKVDGMFSMDDIADDDSNELAECYDSCMSEIFQWIDRNGVKALTILSPIYQNIILPTHGTSNIQFIIMYALSLDVNKVSKFMESLWQYVTSIRIGPSLRQAAIIHITGLLARSSFINLDLIKEYMNKMTEWCHSYIEAQENLKANINSKNPHSVFHCVCQSLFYLISFKHKALFSSKKGVIFIQSLRLPRIVMSSLNPLRTCHPGITETFASVTRIHQIVYCQTVMEHNARYFLRNDQDFNDCQEWFPFDPYTLNKSRKWIAPIYAEYEEDLNIKSEINVENMCDDDDFLANSPSFIARSLNSIH